MVTGTPPCAPCCGREEAPACRGGKGEDASGVLEYHEQMYYVMVNINVLSVWKSHCDEKYIFRHKNNFNRKYRSAVGMQFSLFVFIGLTLEPGGAVRPRNAYTALSSLA